MRYVDTGGRDPKQALGSWLEDVLLTSTPIGALRVQSGFFGSEALGYFAGAFKALAESDGHCRILVGSNDGTTSRTSIADLLRIAGQPRPGLRVGVVSFQSGYFHPKVYHFERADGSSAAYVGSANLTGPGATSLHVEAGVVLDTKEDDPRSLLDSIAAAIDAWFEEVRPGLYEVCDEVDLDVLVAARVLGVSAPIAPHRSIDPAKTGDLDSQQGHSLRPLVALPPTQSPPSPTPQQKGAGVSGGTGSSAATKVLTPPSPGSAAKHWGKKLSSSDAQRKKVGNQRGAITLVQGDYRGKIDQTRYFRHDLFGGRKWTTDTTNTGQLVEGASVPMHVTINGTYRGLLTFKITNASNRESSQNNYTAELHVEPVTHILKQTDVTGMHLDISVDSSGEYWLTIA